MSTTSAQPLGKHEGRAAHRVHGADLVNIQEQM